MSRSEGQAGYRRPTVTSAAPLQFLISAGRQLGRSPQFVDNNCTFTQTYNNNPLPQGGAPASGRIWGHIDCPNAVESGMFGVGIDGGVVLRTCEGSADFLFENCQ